MKANDRTKPRFRKNRHKFESYSKTIAENKELVSVLTYKMYKKILTEFNEAVVQEAIANQNGVDLPKGIGVVFIAACEQPANIKMLNFKLTELHGKNIYHTNMATDSKLCKIFFVSHKTKHKLEDGHIWKLTLTRPHKSTISKAFKENYEKYHFLTKDLKSYNFIH